MIDYRKVAVLVLMGGLLAIVAMANAETNTRRTNMAVPKVSVVIPPADADKKELAKILAEVYVSHILDGDSRSVSSNAAYQAAVKAGWVWNEARDEWVKKSKVRPVLEVK
jgi:hypothetical protein